MLFLPEGFEPEAQYLYILKAMQVLEDIKEDTSYKQTFSLI